MTLNVKDTGDGYHTFWEQQYIAGFKDGNARGTTVGFVWGMGVMLLTVGAILTYVYGFPVY